MLQLIRVWNRQIVSVPHFNYNLRRAAPKQTEYDKERVEYKKLMNQYRSRLVKEYWEEQTKIENQYIEDYLAKEKLKSEKLEIHRRSQTVIQTVVATNQYNRQKNLQQLRNERVRKYLVDSDIRKMNRQQIIRVLNEEAKNWFPETTLYDKVTSSLIIPDTILDQVTYYHDLQEKAILFETASYEHIDKLNDPNAQFEWKNRLGMPIYQRIVSLIKYLKQDNILGKLQFEWDTCRSIILTDNSLDDNEMAEQLEKINGAFETVIATKIAELEADPIKRLEEMHKQVLRLYNLFELWEKYITIVKMDSSTAQQLITASRQEVSMFDSQGNQDFLLASEELIQKKNIRGKEVKVTEGIEDKYISADETHTDSEDIDLEKLSQQKKEKLDADRPSDKTFDFDPDKIKEKQKDYSKEIEELFQNAELTAKKAEKEFEMNYKKNPYQKVFYNDQLNSRNIPDAKSIFEGVDLEALFPKEVFEKSAHPYLEFQSADDIEKHYYELKALYSLRKKEDQNIVVNPDIFKFNTSVTAETYKQMLSKVEVPESYEKLKQETIRLVDAVGEIKLHDADFLLKVWNYYN